MLGANGALVDMVSYIFDFSECLLNENGTM